VREEAVQRTRSEVRDVASTLEKIVLGLDEAERDVRSVIALLREQARGLAGELALVDREMDRAYEALRPGGAPEPEPEEEEAPSDDAEAASTDGAAEAGSGNGAEAKSESKQAAGDGPRAGGADATAAASAEDEESEPEGEDEEQGSDASGDDEPPSKRR
jgi:hypothetical protein